MKKPVKRSILTQAGSSAWELYKAASKLNQELINTLQEEQNTKKKSLAHFISTKKLS